MNPDDPKAAALSRMATTMGRGRFKAALPEEEQREITLILTPSGAEVVSDSGAEDEASESPELEAMEQSTGME